MSRSNTLPVLLLLLLLVGCFTLTGWIEPRFQEAEQSRPQDVMAVLLGDGRRIFANHFFVKADAYFHSGFYPTVFDNQESFKTPHVAADSGATKDQNTGEETAFMGPPRDFIEAFGRNFIPSRHTHLDEGGAQGTNAADLGDTAGGGVREILPWLKISAELDPNRIETYTVTAYWLRKRMGKPDEAEQFLRDGLRANPYNPALLFELGCLYQEDKKDDIRARNIWELGVTKLDALTNRTDQDDYILFRLTLYLARLAEKQENWPVAVKWLEREKTVSPEPALVEKQIAEDKLKINLPTPADTNAPASANKPPS
jgi:tetratricopeptide (TPR) repeat protein